MTAHAKKQLPNAVALLLGFSIAIVFAPLVLATADWYSQWSAEHNPPATLQWNSVERIDTDTLRLTLLITRHRDCDFVRILGYTGATLQSMQPAESLEREDSRAPQSYPVGISVISRPWILRGIYGDKVAVSAYYDCDDRIITAPLLTGDVPEFKP